MQFLKVSSLRNVNNNLGVYINLFLQLHQLLLHCICLWEYNLFKNLNLIVLSISKFPHVFVSELQLLHAINNTGNIQSFQRSSQGGGSSGRLNFPFPLFFISLHIILFWKGWINGFCDWRGGNKASNIQSV